MGETCPDCGRPMDHAAHYLDPTTCAGLRGCGCLAYVAGRRDGIAHAKATATATAYPDGVADIDWTETDRDERGGSECRVTRAAYVRGLREGFAVAAEHVDWKRTDPEGATWAVDIDWTAAIDEIERRAK